MAKNKNTDSTASNKKKKIDIEIEDKKTDSKTGENTPGSTADRDGQQKEQSDGSKEFPENGEEAAETIKTALASANDKYLRLAAEYDNFRKRSAKERETTYSNAKADTVGRLLPVYDNLERALKQECSDEAFYKGIEMTMQQLTEILKDMGVSPIPTVGEPFDPNRHSAVMRIEDPKLGEGIIAEECQKGFILGEKVIRFSTVVVAN